MNRATNIQTVIRRSLQSFLLPACSTLCLLIGSLLVGCGGGGGGGTGSGGLGEVRTSSSRAVSTVVKFAGGSPAAGALGSTSVTKANAEGRQTTTTPFESVFECESSGDGAIIGEIEVTQEPDELSFILVSEIALDNCDSVSGILGLGIGGIITETQIFLTTIITGVFTQPVEGEGECLYATDGLFVDALSDIEGNIQSQSFGGTLDGICDNFTFSCSWTDVNPNDLTAIENGCQFEEIV